MMLIILMPLAVVMMTVATVKNQINEPLVAFKADSFRAVADGSPKCLVLGRMTRRAMQRDIASLRNRYYIESCICYMIIVFRTNAGHTGST